MSNFIKKAIIQSCNTIFLIFLFSVFISCNKTEKNSFSITQENNISENYLLEMFFNTYDEKILNDAIGKRISIDLNTDKFIAYGGFPFAMKKFLKKDLTYYVGFINVLNEFEKGCVILYIKQTKSSEIEDIWEATLLDAKYIPAKKGYRVHQDYICYNLKSNGTCEEDLNKYGIILRPLDGWLPYDIKNIPDYILSFSENELIFSKPLDDNYFLYYSSHFDGI